MSGSNGSTATLPALFYGGTTIAQLFHSGTFAISNVGVDTNVDTTLATTYSQPAKAGALYLNGTPVGTGTAIADNTDPTHVLTK